MSVAVVIGCCCANTKLPDWSVTSESLVSTLPESMATSTGVPALSPEGSTILSDRSSPRVSADAATGADDRCSSMPLCNSITGTRLLLTARLGADDDNDEDDLGRKSVRGAASGLRLACDEDEDDSGETDDAGDEDDVVCRPTL